MSEELRKGGIGEEELKTGLNMIGRQGKNLLELVNQLLEVAKVRSEIGDPEWRTGDIVAYTSMIVEDNRAYAAKAGRPLFSPSETIISMDSCPSISGGSWITYSATLSSSRREVGGLS